MGYKSKTGDILLDHELSFLLFEGNYHDLKKKADLVALPQYMTIKMDMDSGGEDDFIDLLRHIHNFLLSAATLVDHYRVFMKGQLPENFIIKYDNKKDEVFVNDVLACVVKKLRNFYAHYTVPASHLTFKLGTISFSLYWIKDELLAWDGWNVKEKEFISSLLPEIEVLPLLEPYYLKSKEFYSWFVENYHLSQAE